MKLIVIILCLCIERYLGWGEKLRQVSWFSPYCRYMANVLHKFNEGNGWFGFALFLLPLLLVAMLALGLLSIPMWGLLELFFSAAVLMYCMPAEAYVSPEHDGLLLAEEAQAEPAPAAKAAAKKSAPMKQADAATEASDDATAKDATGATPMPAKTAAVPASPLVKAHQEVFAVMFWFVLLGIVGALLYWVCVRVQEEAHAAKAWARGAAKVQPYLDWLPARLMTLSFALVGNFVGSFVQWLKHVLAKPAENETLLNNSANAAIGQEIGSVLSESHVMALAKRTLVVWLVLVAILTLTAWIS